MKCQEGHAVYSASWTVSVEHGHHKVNNKRYTDVVFEMVVSGEVGDQTGRLMMYIEMGREEVDSYRLLCHRFFNGSSLVSDI